MRQYRAKVLSVIGIFLLVTLACTLFLLKKNLSSPSTPTQTPIASIPSNQTESNSAITNKDGIATFEDPISGNNLKVEFKDVNTRDPLSDIEVWFISNGPQVLVFTNDPSGEYAPAIKELTYDQLSRLSSSFKLSSPSKSLSLGTVILLIELVDAYQTMAEWRAYLAQFPELKSWQTGEVELCINPLQLGEGASLILKGVVESLLPGGKSSQIIEGFTMVFKESVVDENIENSSRKIAKQANPAIYRVTLFSLKGNVPKLLKFEGLCLDWLDLSDPQSSLDWLVYGLNNHDMYALAAITNTDDLKNANWYEGFQPINRETYLNQLKSRINSKPNCDGLTAQNGCIQVWTSKWSPAWKVTENCYAECVTYDEPWESKVAAFSICNFDGATAKGPNYDGEWRIRGMYINTPENFFMSGDYQMESCQNPDASIVDNNPAPSASNQSILCPGTPEQRMEINQRGFVCTKNDSVMVRRLPLSSSDIITRLPPGSEFLVIDGPSCGTWSWWLIETDNGERGWMAEGGDQSDPYFICPLP